jgi:hypothetical protein
MNTSIRSSGPVRMIHDNSPRIDGAAHNPHNM